MRIFYIKKPQQNVI